MALFVFAGLPALVAGCGGGGRDVAAPSGNAMLFVRPGYQGGDPKDIYFSNAVPEYLSDSGHLTKNPWFTLRKSADISSDVYTSSTPALSPDGKKIAFTMERGSYTDIAIMNADGSSKALLTNSKTSGEGGSHPSFSPDGRKIVFSARDGAFHRIFVMNTNGSGLRMLAGVDERDCIMPSYSPDGRKIVFGAGEICVMNADGSSVTPLTHNGGYNTHPVFSPDGSRIAYSCEKNGKVDIYIMYSNGAGSAPLTHGEGWNYSPAFSPDGIKIAFTSDRFMNSQTQPNAMYEIFMMNANGSGVTRLTYGGGADPFWIADHRR